MSFHVCPVQSTFLPIWPTRESLMRVKRHRPRHSWNFSELTRPEILSLPGHARKKIFPEDPRSLCGTPGDKFSTHKPHLRRCWHAVGARRIGWDFSRSCASADSKLSEELVFGQAGRISPACRRLLPRTHRVAVTRPTALSTIGGDVIPRHPRFPAGTAPALVLG
jgi:hypothetical protein